MDELWPLAAGLSGLAAGGVANSLIDRLPRERPFELGLLKCSRCRRRGSVIDILPVLGWLAREGRCRVCRAHQPVQIPVVEALNGVLWLLVAAAGPPTARSVAVMVFSTLMLILSLIDLEHQILPDILTLPGIVLGLVATRLPGWPVTLLDAALSAGVGYFFMMGLAKAAEAYYGEEALGQGDWKMVAMLGAFLGSTKAVAAVLAATVAGALIGLLLVALLGKEGRQKLPLGTFLGASAVVMLFV